VSVSLSVRRLFISGEERMSTEDYLIVREAFAERERPRGEGADKQMTK
jgi:hypothetical protein